MVKNRNPKSEFAKECIYNAMVNLLEVKEFDNISISEIVERAGVSRMTYYRNYTSKTDILRSYCDELFEKFLAEVSQDNPITLYSYCLRYFTVFREHSKLFRGIQKARLEAKLLGRFADYLEILSSSIYKTECDPHYVKYFSKFIAGGILGIHIAWIEGNMMETDDEMARILVDFMKKADMLDLTLSDDATDLIFHRHFDYTGLLTKLHEKH